MVAHTLPVSLKGHCPLVLPWVEDKHKQYSNHFFLGRHFSVNSIVSCAIVGLCHCGGDATVGVLPPWGGATIGWCCHWVVPSWGSGCLVSLPLQWHLQCHWLLLLNKALSVFISQLMISLSFYDCLTCYSYYVANKIFWLHSYSKLSKPRCILCNTNSNTEPAAISDTQLKKACPTA